MNINGSDDRSKFVVFMYETVIQYQINDIRTNRFQICISNAIDVIVHREKFRDPFLSKIQCDKQSQ